MFLPVCVCEGSDITWNLNDEVLALEKDVEFAMQFPAMLVPSAHLLWRLMELLFIDATRFVVVVVVVDIQCVSQVPLSAL